MQVPRRADAQRSPITFWVPLRKSYDFQFRKIKKLSCLSEMPQRSCSGWRIARLHKPGSTDEVSDSGRDSKASRGRSRRTDARSLGCRHATRWPLKLRMVALSPLTEPESETTPAVPIRAATETHSAHSRTSSLRLHPICFRDPVPQPVRHDRR